MLALFLDDDFPDGVKDYSPPTSGGVPTDLDAADVYDGDFWAAFGDGSWTISLISNVLPSDDVTDVDEVLAADNQDAFAEVEFSVSQVKLGVSILDFSGTTIVEGLQSSQLFGADGVDGGLVSSDLSFQGTATVIPLPSAVWAGLVLMGGLPIARRFRRRGADL
jgi:hypothetical protein